MHLIETVNVFSESPKIDEEAGVIRGVKILGLKSTNNRNYPLATLKEARAKYELKPVNLNHLLPGTSESARDVEAGFGRLENIVVRDDGLFGDLAFLKTHPFSARVCEACRRMPEQFGMSHNASGTMKGKDVVSIDHVYCVDLVRYPATVKSLFESHLDEIDHMAGQELPSGTDVLGQSGDVKSHLRSAIIALLSSDLSHDELKRKINSLLDMTEKITAGMPESDTQQTEDKTVELQEKVEGEKLKVDGQKDNGDTVSGLDPQLSLLTSHFSLLSERIDAIERDMQINQLLSEQNIDRKKLVEADLKSLREAKTKEDMKKLAEEFGPQVRIVSAVRPAFLQETKTTSYDDLRKQLVA